MSCFSLSCPCASRPIDVTSQDETLVPDQRVVSLVPVQSLMLVPLENRFPIPEPLPEKIDGVIVLGGSEIPMLTEIRGQVSLTDSVERLTTFLSLARRFPKAKLV